MSPDERLVAESCIKIMLNVIEDITKTVILLHLTPSFPADWEGDSSWGFGKHMSSSAYLLKITSPEMPPALCFNYEYH